MEYLRHIGLEKRYIAILETAISWVLALGMLVYGVGKVRQFSGITARDTYVSEFTPMELMWAFYRASQDYVYIIGGFEILGGFLVLFYRTRLIGCLLLTAILTNIILQDIFYSVHLGALATAIWYQYLVIILMLMDYNRVKRTIVTAFTKKPKALIKYDSLMIIFLILSVIAIRIIEYVLTIHVFN